ncbi:MAG: regulatory iron-sulfur-containing complex subunit RicT [Spirochaetota bacterium]
MAERVSAISSPVCGHAGKCAEIQEDTYFIVKVVHSSETELCRFDEDSDVSRLHCGDAVIVSSRYGLELARVLGPIAAENADAWEHVRSVERVATDADIARFEENLERESEALEVCREKIDAHGLSMKLVSAHYMLEEPKILFFFTADTRVDFRELVKDLVSEFRMRIELRQIGVRDDSRVLGGTGVCGRVLCCHGITDKLRPVSIKMAKVQNLSLNSMKISGPCGRLLCCLAYEYDYYTERKQKLPSDGSRIQYDGSAFQVSEVNVISNEVRLFAREDGRYLTISGKRLSYDKVARRWYVVDEQSEETTGNN